MNNIGNNMQIDPPFVRPLYSRKLHIHTCVPIRVSMNCLPSSVQMFMPDVNSLTVFNPPSSCLSVRYAYLDLKAASEPTIILKLLDYFVVLSRSIGHFNCSPAWPWNTKEPVHEISNIVAF